MAELVPMNKAAELAKVTRQTIARWVKTGRLKRVGQRRVRNLTATTVDPDEVRALVATITAGRPSAKRGRRPTR